MFILQALAQSRRRALQTWRSLPFWTRRPIRGLSILFHVKQSCCPLVASDRLLRQGLTQGSASQGAAFQMI